MTEFICITVTVIIIFLLLVLKRKIGYSVRRDKSLNTVNELIYTCASSTYPPFYQRYRFYTENEKRYFYSEKREGNSWPLKEADITVSVLVELSQEEWNGFLKYIKGGKFEKAEKNTDSGNSGPWIYLRCGYRSKLRYFTFSSISAKNGFEDYCKNLVLSKK